MAQRLTSGTLAQASAPLHFKACGCYVWTWALLGVEGWCLGEGHEGVSCASLRPIYIPGFAYCDYCLQGGRIYRSWVCLGVKNKGGWLGFDRGVVFKGGSSEPLEPPLVTGMSLQKTHWCRIFLSRALEGELCSLSVTLEPNLLVLGRLWKTWFGGGGE